VPTPKRASDLPTDQLNMNKPEHYVILLDRFGLVVATTAKTYKVNISGSVY
jgi:hypothetical protein